MIEKKSLFSKKCVCVCVCVGGGGGGIEICHSGTILDETLMAEFIYTKKCHLTPNMKTFFVDINLRHQAKISQF